MSKGIENLITNWDNILVQLKEDYDISDRVFETFIKDIIKPIKFEKGTLYLEVPEEGYISFLQNKILSQLRILISHELKINTEDLKIVIYSKNNSVDKIISENEDFESLLKAAGINEPLNNFENFVQGSSNAIAYATAIAIAENPGENYNPFFLYGKTGLGKTHLVQAIANYALKKNNKLKVLFTTCEKYLQDFVNNISHDANTFKNKYRNVDMLIIDDIHGLAGKRGIQDDFFNTFNELHSNKKQIILTSDRPIREFGEDLDDRLKSRFNWGLPCEIYMPDYETRIAIIRKKIENIKPEFPIDNEIVKYIAQNVKTNVRELESCIKSIILCSRLWKKPLDLELAKERLEILNNHEKKKITPEKIVNIVCDYFGLNVLDVCGQKRNRDFVYARDIGIYLCRDYMKDITLEKIGCFFGNRDHSTVINSCTKIEKKIKLQDQDLIDNINSIKEKIEL